MAEERRGREEKRSERRVEVRRTRADEQGRTGYGFEDSSLTSTVVAGVAVALLKPELLAGMAIGVAATMGPRLIPVVGSVLRPIFSTVVRAGYATVAAGREVAAEANEQLQDMVAEARADYEEVGVGNGQRRAAQTQRARARA
jgi:Protein of unknown function (DUF5132)